MLPLSFPCSVQFLCIDLFLLCWKSQDKIYYVNYFFAFVLKLDLFWWLWLMGSYRFEVPISIIHNLYIVLYAHYPKSDHLPSPYMWPPSPFISCFPLVTRILLSISVYEFQFYIPYVSEIIQFLASSDWLTNLA